MSLSRLELFLESMSFPSLAVSPFGDILASSPTCCAFLYHDKGSIVGKKIEVLLPGSFRGAHAKHREAFSKSSLSWRKGEGRYFPILRGDGVQEEVEIALSSLVNIEGQDMILASFLAFRDVHERLKGVKQKLDNIEIRMSKGKNGSVTSD